MKRPRISRYFGGWRCAVVNVFVPCGYGKSPAAAYAAWLIDSEEKRALMLIKSREFSVQVFEGLRK